MPRFEVYIPASDGSGLNVTFRVDATNWMAALKTGFTKLGEQGFQIHNVMVDVREDNTLHVTETASGRVFRIRELNDQEAALAAPKRIPTRPPFSWQPPPPPPPSSPPSPQAPPGLELKKPAPPGGPAAPAPPGPPPAAAASAPGFESFRPASERPAAVSTPSPIRAARAKNAPSAIVELEAPVAAVTGSIGRARAAPQSPRQQVEDVLADVFDRVTQVQAMRKVEDGLYFLLDLALEKIPAESGSALRASAGTGDLSFVTARGPKADELLKARIVLPAGTGIAGFCAVEGVSLALSDVQKDPRYYSAVSDRVSYETRSLLCAPMMLEGRTFGAMQLLNRKEGSAFTEHETGLLAYIAHQAALFLRAR